MPWPRRRKARARANAQVNPAKKAYYILRYLGPRFVSLRMRILLTRRLGFERRKWRSAPWESIDLERVALAGTPTAPGEYAEFKRRQSPPFLFPLGQPPAIPETIRQAPRQRQPDLAERLRLLAEDRCVHFFHIPASKPIDWYTSEVTGGRADARRPWHEIPDFDPAQGDVRTLWEPGRATWAIDAARAHARGMDVEAGTLFWRWVDSWMNACPPFVGVHWKCGQEATVRLIAIALGIWSLAADAATTPDRWVQFARLAWATGYRIHHHIHYAISQKNNHAISEACGLLLISQLFPEFRDAAEWRARGRRVMTRELRRQIYADGSYVQHSTNYQRVMLHGALLGLRLTELQGDPLERDIYERVNRSSDQLFELMDPDTGCLPNHGPNDGALVLPLSECDFTDYRPVIQAVHFLVRRERLLPPGQWDEDLLWLFGPDSLGAESPVPPRAASSAFEDGGYYTLRQRHSWAMIRCHTYRDRPSHCDGLHVDLWWRGQNVLCDSGSFRYYIPDNPALEYYFKSTAAHNTVEIDGRDPRELVSRFLWLPWPRARVRRFETGHAGAAIFEGEDYGYDRAPWHIVRRRTLVALDGDVWIVVDDLLGEGEHQATLRWHLLDGSCTTGHENHEVRLETPAGDVFIAVATSPAALDGFDVIRGCDEPGRILGFAAPYYGECLPIPTLEAVVRADLPQRLITTVSPQQAASIRCTEAKAGRETWQLATPETSYTLELAAPTRRVEKTLLQCSVSQEKRCR